IKHITKVENVVLKSKTVKENMNIVETHFIRLGLDSVTIGNGGKEVHIRYTPSSGFQFKNIPDLGLLGKWYVIRQRSGPESQLRMSLNRHSFRHCNKYRGWTDIEKNSLYFASASNSQILKHCESLGKLIASEFKFGQGKRLVLVDGLTVAPVFTYSEDNKVKFKYQSFEVATGHEFIIDKKNHFFINKGPAVLDSLSKKHWNGAVAWGRCLSYFGRNFYVLDDYRNTESVENYQDDRKLEDYEAAMGTPAAPFSATLYRKLFEATRDQDFIAALRIVSGGRVPDNTWFAKRNKKKKRN
ncbi:MAG: hypothetical protein AAFV85_17910, partial [Cyanobacteria bacterium J06634_6]